MNIEQGIAEYSIPWSKDQWDAVIAAAEQVLSESGDDDSGGELYAAYECVFPARSHEDANANTSPCMEEIDPDTMGDERANAYEKLLQANCPEMSLGQDLYHVTTLSYFLEAQKAGGFFLARPMDWSVNWEDTPFKRLREKIEKGLKGRSEDKVFNASLVQVYQRSTFGMCWSLNAANRSVVEMERRKHPGEPIVVLRTTARDLLKAYYRDRTALIRCFLLKMKYLKRKELQKVDPNLEDLGNANIGTALHVEADSMTHVKFADQNEVRLIIEDCPEDTDKTYDIRVDCASPKPHRVLLVKHVDVFSVVKGIDVYPNGPEDAIRICPKPERQVTITFHHDR